MVPLHVGGHGTIPERRARSPFLGILGSLEGNLQRWTSRILGPSPFQRILGKLKRDARWRIFRLLAPLFRPLGLQITANVYFSPIPDPQELGENLWKQETALWSIDINEPGQLHLLSEFVERFQKEYDRFPLERSQISFPWQFYENNGEVEGVDGHVLYCMIRQFKSRRIYEVGSGNSTYLSAQAVLENKAEGGPNCELLAYDPFPGRIVRQGFPGLSGLEIKKKQEVPLSRFSALEKNDILFIDSSHVLKTGSDVQFEYLEILPRLNPGVLVHSYDISLPREYPRDRLLRMGFFLRAVPAPCASLLQPRVRSPLGKQLHAFEVPRSVGKRLPILQRAETVAV